MKKKDISVRDTLETAIFDIIMQVLIPMMKNSQLPPADFFRLIIKVYAKSLVTGELAKVTEEAGMTPEAMMGYFRRGLFRAINKAE